MRYVNILLISVCAVMTLACTRVLTTDNSISENELCLVKSENTCVMAIDDKKVPYSGGGFAKFKITPGEHTITIGLYDQSRYPYVRTSKSDSTIKFTGLAAHRYTTRPRYNGDLWMAEIVDDETKLVVSN